MIIPIGDIHCAGDVDCSRTVFAKSSRISMFVFVIYLKEIAFATELSLAVGADTFSFSVLAT